MDYHLRACCPTGTYPTHLFYASLPGIQASLEYHHLSIYGNCDPYCCWGLSMDYVESRLQPDAPHGQIEIFMYSIFACMGSGHCTDNSRRSYNRQHYNLDPHMPYDKS